MDDSSDEDFISLPGPSTRARVERKEWPAEDDPGGTSSKKVGGGSGRKMKKESKMKALNSEEKTKLILKTLQEDVHRFEVAPFKILSCF